MARSREKWGFWLWIFAKGREIGGVYWSVIGHRLRVGAEGRKGKVQEWCRLVWTGVEMWEMGVDLVSGRRRSQTKGGPRSPLTSETASFPSPLPREDL
jgi:hypothetical protein